MHLDLSTLEALAAGTLVEPELSQASRHVEACPKCNEVWAEMTRPGMGRKAPSDASSTGAQQAEDPTRVGEARPDLLSPPPLELIGPYVLLEKLGEGGMGTVYSAYHRELDRKVALKLIHSSPEDANSQARLLREAQAMARLDHPNVVAVHDFGRFQDQVYLAMDRVEGKTLKGWLTEKPRSWREVVTVFLQAGKGLVAAHAAGMVHRDFKPANVLVGTDGRVRVSDFGLARAVGGAEDITPEGSVGPTATKTAETSGEKTARELRRVVPVPQSLSGLEKSLLSSQLTQFGLVTGTPKYMSPEQFDGHSGDQRSDQFSFCVALYESLYGETPFDGRPGTFQLRGPSKGRKVPRFLRRALIRGLSVDPAKRFATMDALLAELSRDPARQLLRVAIAVGVTCLAVATVIFGRLAFRAPPLPGCESPGTEWKGTWDSSARAGLQHAFDGAQVLAADSAASVAEIDRYTSEWSKVHAEACAAGENSRVDDTLLSRLTCLGRQRSEASALIQAIGQGDEAELKGARDIFSGLLPPSRCADPRVLAALPRPPSDPSVQLEVEQLRVKLAVARVEARSNAKEALPKLQAISARATELHYRPLEAEALLALGRADDDVGNAETAKADYLKAANAAEAGGADLFAAEVASEMAFELGGRLGKLDLAEEWLDRGRARLERVGGDRYVESLLESSAVIVAGGEGKPDEALAHARTAERYATEALGASNIRTLADAVTAAQRTLGVLPPDQTQAQLEATLSRLKAAGAPVRLAWQLVIALEQACIWQGHFDEAEQWIAEEERVNAAAGRGGIWQGFLLSHRALLRLWQHQSKEGLVLIERAEDIIHDADAPELLAVEGQLREDLGDHRGAERILTRSLAIFEEWKIKDQLSTADASRALGTAETMLNEAAKAKPRLEGLLRVVESHQNYPGELDRARLALAEALVEDDRKSSRGRDLARQALRGLDKLPWFSEDAKVARDFLSRRRVALGEE